MVIQPIVKTAALENVNAGAFMIDESAMGRL
jgi:hypothetical protein